MGLRFIGQPFPGGGQIGRVVTDALQTPGASSLWIATAWGKQSGIGRIQSAVADFHAAGGSSEVIVGIDEGGATREGLAGCLDVFSRVFVYYDPGTRTFHPKIYAVEGDAGSVLVVGSGNLTKGGLFTNYEAAFVLDTERGQPEWAVRDEVRAYFDRLLGGGDALRELDAALIDLLADEGWVTSEARQNRRRSAESHDRRARQQVFGAAVGGLAGAPASAAPALPEDDQDEDSAFPPASALVDADDAGIEPPPAGGDAEEDDVGKNSGFWKRLSNWDASRSSAPGQIQIPIRFLDFFPEMSDEGALTAGLGQGQSAAYFEVAFRDGTFTKRIPEARVILYEPAPHQPRSNSEIRFTFHDREVFERLSALDVLVFDLVGGRYQVERRDPGSMAAGYYGWLP